MVTTTPALGGTMRAGPPGLPAGIVFRRLHSADERALAWSLLAAGGRPWPEDPAGGLAWFGLWDLAAGEEVALIGVAAIRPVAAATAELCALAVPAEPPWQGLGDRLLREVADTLRAEGVERMVARVDGDDGRVALLRDAGLVPLSALGRQDLPSAAAHGADGAGVWLSLEL
jgi:GNAT superfamily N-acetyltransferase